MSASLDADKWLDDFFTDDASLQYANNPVIYGSTVREMFKTVFAKLDIMTHEVVDFGQSFPHPPIRMRAISQAN
jgi:hypothetical protein